MDAQCGARVRPAMLHSFFGLKLNADAAHLATSQRVWDSLGPGADSHSASVVLTPLHVGNNHWVRANCAGACLNVAHSNAMLAHLRAVKSARVRLQIVAGVDLEDRVLLLIDSLEQGPHRHAVAMHWLALLGQWAARVRRWNRQVREQLIAPLFNTALLSCMLVSSYDCACMCSGEVAACFLLTRLCNAGCEGSHKHVTWRRTRRP